MRKIITTIVAAWLFVGVCVAQNDAERPASIAKRIDNSDVPVLTMPAIDVEAILAEEAGNLKARPYKYGETIEMDINSNDHGLWTELKTGKRVWRVGIECKQAFSIDLNFSNVQMAETGKLWIYSEDGEVFQGPFTSEDILEDGSFGTFPIGYDVIYVEYYEQSETPEGSIAIDGVTHGFRDLFTNQRGGGSGACNNNVACPEGDPWEDEIRSVAIIISGGGGVCTGTMVNNTASDCTPYFLTANHCLGGSVSNWRFKFDYQAANCNGSGAPTLGGGNFTLGSQIRASNAGSDMGLLELNTTPPADHNVYYAGWDNSGSASSSSTCIHHPSGDIKKISFDTDNTTTSNFGGAQCWHISDWEDGTTEPGSSGSGLWNQNHHLIGQLYGGAANCSNNVDDYYGRFDVSWDGSNSSNRLRDWLDPGNTGATTLNGFSCSASTNDNDAALTSIIGLPEGDEFCESTFNLSISLKNNGLVTMTSATINYTVDGLGYPAINWTGSLSSGQSEDVDLPVLNLSNGSHTLIFEVTAPNGVPDEDNSNNTVTETFSVIDGYLYTLTINTDQYPDETTWELKDDQGATIATGGPYSTANGTETKTFCLPIKCYIFTIFDEYSDGICCGYGNGSYTITDPWGGVVASGGEFGASEATNFCANSIDDLELASSIQLYPNPTNGVFSVEVPLSLKSANIEVLDMMGKVVMTTALSGQSRSTVDLSDLEGGSYYVRFYGGEKTASKKVVLIK